MPTSNKHGMLDKIDGIQLLRTAEIDTLKAVRRVLSERRKNNYRKEIIDHICPDNIAPYMDLVRDSDNMLPDKVFRWFDVLSQTALVTKAGARKEFPEYRGNTIYNKHHQLRMYIREIDNVYSFNAKLVNEVVKLLHTIDYDGGDRVFRSCLAAMHAVNYKTTRFCYEEVTDLGLYSSIFSSNKDNPLVRKWIRIDESQKRHYYEITEYGFYVVHVWREITKLIEKENSHELSPVVG